MNQSTVIINSAWIAEIIFKWKKTWYGYKGPFHADGGGGGIHIKGLNPKVDFLSNNWLSPSYNNNTLLAIGIAKKHKIRFSWTPSNLETEFGKYFVTSKSGKTITGKDLTKTIYKAVAMDYFGHDNIIVSDGE